MVSLTAVGRLQTSGARAVEPFHIDGALFVAVPQLAIDIPGQTPDINGGDSDTSLLVFRADNGGFVEHQRLDAPGGEDAEFFRIGGRKFLATASIRTGHGPYEFGTESLIFEWRTGRFEPFQAIPPSPPNSGRPSPPSDGISSRWLKGSADLVSTGRTSRQ
jgi:EPTP domain